MTRDLSWVCSMVVRSMLRLIIIFNQFENEMTTGDVFGEE